MQPEFFLQALSAVRQGTVEHLAEKRNVHTILVTVLYLFDQPNDAVSLCLTSSGEPRASPRFLTTVTQRIETGGFSTHES